MKTIGYMVHPNGEIEEIPLTIDGAVMWGKEHDEKGLPAWLAPDTLSLTDNSSIVLLNSHNITPIALPNMPHVRNNIEIVSSIMSEQFQKRLYRSNTGKDSIQSRITFMIVAIILTLIISLVAAGFFLPQIIENWRG